MRAARGLLAAACMTALLAGGEGALWVSWDTFEPDSCAAAWVIQRHVDQKARFKFLPRGTAIREGTAFDTPDSKLRRYATVSTTESILREYKVSDAVALEVGRIIHDIEINRWDRKSTAESREVERRIREIVARAKSHDELLARSLEYFDALAERIRNSQKTRK